MSLSITAEAEVGYTYNYDYWDDIQYSPDAYSVVGVYTATELGLDLKLNAPQGMYTTDNMIYICDTGNNRIIEIKRSNVSEMTVMRVIDSFNGIENNAFLGPTDVFVTEDGFFYICDKGNNRIVKLDKDLNYIMEFTKPSDATFDQSLSFLPNKLIVDSVGRVYCIADNINKGLIKFESDGSFTGFLGATKVIYDWTDYIWKKFATKAQREALESFVPTEYDNICIDDEGFIYACTTNVKTSTLKTGDAQPIRKLNLMGSDILIRNGYTEVIGDIQWDNAGGYKGSALITDVTTLSDDIYVGLDKVRGHIFAYDSQGNMLFAFGGSGNMDGYFRLPSAIDQMGNDLVVLDQTDNSFTVFTLTAYGTTMYEAIELYNEGKYIESGEAWEEVLAMNGNCDLAYIGIGRSLMRQKKYKEAMDYFKLKYDDDNYSKAFQQYRKQWVENNIIGIIVVLFILIIIPLVIGKIKKIKFEIDTADIFKV